jgi:hypothetical protein
MLPIISLVSFFRTANAARWAVDQSILDATGLTVQA